MGYSLENGINWLLGGNELDICYTERQNDGEYENPICWDLTDGQAYKDMILSHEFLSFAVFALGIVALILFLRSKKRVKSKA